MSVVAIYNMKGGVGKTTAAVNLAYLSAQSGRRVLLWDLDPQAAATFAFRIRARVDGFGKKTLADAAALGAAIRETDYPNLDLLPADFAYRKLDRLLERLGKPKRVVASLLEQLGDAYDLVLLDCPAGYSLFTEGIVAAADTILVPAIPSAFSLRTISPLIARAERLDAKASLAVFFSMVDRRKSLHRLTCEWSAQFPDVFLDVQVPYASVVEQMAVRRAPLPIFAGTEPAALAFAQIWRALESRPAQSSWALRQQAIDDLLDRLEWATTTGPAARPRAQVIDLPSRRLPGSESGVVHRFDTTEDDLGRVGMALEFHERKDSLVVAISQPGGRAQVEIDKSWAFAILSGTMSPLDALARRLGTPGPAVLAAAVGLLERKALLRVESRLTGSAAAVAAHEPPASLDLDRVAGLVS